MKLRLAILSSLLLFDGRADVQPAVTDYAIRLTRKAAVGDRFKIIASSSDKMSVTIDFNGQVRPGRDQLLAYEFTADCEVLAVTPTGRELKIELVVGNLLRTTFGETRWLLQPGTIVMMEHVGGKTILSQDGNPLDASLAAAFGALGIAVSDDNQPSEDMIFGTAKRKKVGDSWPINATAAAAVLAKTDVKAEAANITGAATLGEVIQMEGQPVLRVAATMEIRAASLPMLTGLDIQSSQYSSNYSGLFPVNPERRKTRETLVMSMKVTAKAKRGGTPMVMTVTKDSSHDIKFIQQ